MWFLFWFQIINNNITSYNLGQFPTEEFCIDQKKEAVVLITGSNTALYCFEVKESK